MAEKKKKPIWHSGTVRKLRRHLAMTQWELAQELGTRQQTISEWELGMYTPRGTSVRLLSLIAEEAGYWYQVEPIPEPLDRGEGAEGRS
ncbi:MAG: helix-turn-helix transcriptional regulator [Chloroflexi bacterium]|nr:helix-turn-helix transcriptional regulator [Chloroflexota bacterium]